MTTGRVRGRRSRQRRAPGTVRDVMVDGRSVCVGPHRSTASWGAIENVCTHDGGVLGEGELDGDAVECPRHGGRFDLFTGRVLALPPVRPGQGLPGARRGRRDRGGPA